MKRIPLAILFFCFLIEFFMIGVKVKRTHDVKQKRKSPVVAKQNLEVLTKNGADFMHQIKPVPTPDFEYSLATTSQPYTANIVVDPLAPLKKGVVATEFKETNCEELLPEEPIDFEQRSCAEITYSNEVQSVLDFRDGKLRARTDFSPSKEILYLVFTPQGKVKIRNLEQPKQHRIITEKYFPIPGASYQASYTDTTDQSGFEISYVQDGISYTFFQSDGKTSNYWLEYEGKHAYLFIPHDAEYPFDEGTWQQKGNQAILTLSKGNIQLRLMNSKPKEYCDIYPNSCTLTIVE